MRENIHIGEPLSEGSYEFTLSWPKAVIMGFPVPPPPSEIPDISKTVGNWYVDFSHYSADYKAYTVTFIITLTKNQQGLQETSIPLAAIVTAIGAIVGLAILYFTVEKIEKIVVDSPTGSLLPLGLLGIVAIYFLREVKGFRGTT